MTIQQQLATRLYELLPHKKELEWYGSYDKYGDLQHQGQREQTITLADLLMAIGKDVMLGNEKIDVSITPFKLWIAKKDEPMNKSYNLSKDNILDQSDEFCEFVLELLK